MVLRARRQSHQCRSMQTMLPPAAAGRCFVFLRNRRVARGILPAVLRQLTVRTGATISIERCGEPALEKCLFASTRLSLIETRAAPSEAMCKLRRPGHTQRALRAGA